VLNDTLVRYGSPMSLNCEHPLPVKSKMANGAQIINC